MNGTATVSDNLWADAVQVAAGGAGAGGGFVFFRWFLNWLTGRHDKREAQIDAKDTALDERWAAYTKKMEERSEKLEGRCGRLEEEVEDCHRSKRELETRIARLEGIDQGMGEVRQIGQRAASLDSQIKRKLGRDE